MSSPGSRHPSSLLPTGLVRPSWSKTPPTTPPMPAIRSLITNRLPHLTDLDTGPDPDDTLRLPTVTATTLRPAAPALQLLYPAQYCGGHLRHADARLTHAIGYPSKGLDCCKPRPAAFCPFFLQSPKIREVRQESRQSSIIPEPSRACARQPPVLAE